MPLRLKASLCAPFRYNPKRLLALEKSEMLIEKILININIVVLPKGTVPVPPATHLMHGTIIRGIVIVRIVGCELHAHIVVEGISCSSRKMTNAAQRMLLFQLEIYRKLHIACFPRSTQAQFSPHDFQMRLFHIASASQRRTRHSSPGNHLCIRPSYGRS